MTVGKIKAQLHLILIGYNVGFGPMVAQEYPYCLLF